jgi:hypothetical protein
MSQLKLKPVTTYLEPSALKKIQKKRGKRGFISESAYLRYLIQQDIEEQD